MIDPVVSVLLPTYNRPAWLKEALDSLIEQDVPIQLIILNNGSNDAYTSCIIHDYAHKFADFIHIHSDTNSFKNMGSMLSNATCDYVVNFCDDDRMLPGNLKRKLDLLESDVLAGFAYSPAQCIDAHGNRLGRTMGSGASSLSLDDMLPTSQVVMSGVMLVKQACCALPDVDCMYGEWLIYLTILERGFSALGIDEPLTELRLHSQSDTEVRGRKGRKSLDSHFNVWKHWVEERSIKPKPETWIKMLEVFNGNALDLYGQSGEYLDEMRKFISFLVDNGGELG